MDGAVAGRPSCATLLKAIANFEIGYRAITSRFAVDLGCGGGLDQNYLNSCRSK